MPERRLLSAVAPDHERAVRGRRGRRAVLVPRAPHVDDASVEGRDAHTADEVVSVRCYGQGPSQGVDLIAVLPVSASPGGYFTVRRYVERDLDAEPTCRAVGQTRQS